MPEVPHSFAFVIRAAADVIWGVPTIAILLGTGLILTIRYRFVQIRCFADAWKTALFRRSSGRVGVLTPFQAFATALAATIGTGSIAGVATAIVSGGPGAVFWIWTYSFFATSIKFTEVVLGITFREDGPAGTVRSGPMYYLRNGLRKPVLAWTFALTAGTAALLTTPFTQPNSIAVAFESQLEVPRIVSGCLVAALVWLVVIGGIRSIGRAAEKLAPLKVGLYFICALVVVVSHIDQLPTALKLIVRGAFTLRGVSGGTLGIGVLSAMRYGLARGAMANEAGYGTAAVAYGTARNSDPIDEGLYAIVEVFITFVVSSVTAFAILTSGVWQSGLTSTALVARAFDTSLPKGGWLLAMCAFLFGYTTLIGWAYYGEQFFEYAFGFNVATPYRWIYCCLIVVGSTLKVDTVWAWGDLLNGLQIFPNIVGLVWLSGTVARRLTTVCAPCPPQMRRA